MSDRVVVVGGGVTGVSVARDLVLGGTEVTLLERDGLNAGTSGRMHGLCHSGGRYAVEDPEAARECVRERRTLARIAPAALRETGGLFVSLERDDPEYAERKRAACKRCEIPVADVTDGAAGREPALSGVPFERVLRVPDAVVYPSRLVAGTAADARDHGAVIRTDAPATDLRVEAGRVTGVVTPDGTVPADHVVNAAGAWAGAVAAMAGCDLAMRPTRGVMAVVDRTCGAVLNRCRPPADGDIVVPHADRAILGTTSVPVDDPDDYPTEASEIERVVDACGALLPGLSRADVTAAYWGVRPIPAGSPGANDALAGDPGGARERSRGFSVIAHDRADGVAGLTSVVGGKLTTARLMAEAAADRVRDRLGATGGSRTASEPLAAGDDPAALDALVAAFGASAPADRDVTATGGPGTPPG